jgi:hypothetical protein
MIARRVGAAQRRCMRCVQAERLLREAGTTLRALMRPTAVSRAEPDIAALTQADATASTSPRPNATSEARSVAAARDRGAISRALSGA